MQILFKTVISSLAWCFHKLILQEGNAFSFHHCQIFQCITSMSLGLVHRAQGFYFSLPGFRFILMSLQLPPCSNVRICYSLRKNSTLLVY